MEQALNKPKNKTEFQDLPSIRVENTKTTRRAKISTSKEWKELLKANRPDFEKMYQFRKISKLDLNLNQ
jgi:hypothetical protein